MSHLKYKKEEKDINITGSYKDLIKDIEDRRKITFKNSYNQTEFNKFTTNTDSSHAHFAGGSWEDSTGLKNLDSFKKTLAEFRRNKLEEKVKARIDFSPKRKRQLSEHDGDWDFDKQWDIKAFNNSKRQMVPVNIVDIHVDMSISAVMSAEDINKYGALVWSIIQMIETLGIQANVKIVHDSTGTASNLDSKIELVIKKAGEYISPIALATCFQSVFYRRVIFAGLVFAAEESGKQVSYGLGTPRFLKSDKYVWFEKGVIYTRAGGMFNSNEVENAILQLLGKRII